MVTMPGRDRLYRYICHVMNCLRTCAHTVKNTNARESTVPPITGMAMALKHSFKCVTDQSDVNDPK